MWALVRNVGERQRPDGLHSIVRCRDWETGGVTIPARSCWSRLPCRKAQLIAARRGVSLPFAHGPAHREGGTGATLHLMLGAVEWTVKLASYSVMKMRARFCPQTALAT